MNYNEIINSNKVVLVEFFASWCPHCQRMMPVVAEVKEKERGEMSLALKRAANTRPKPVSVAVIAKAPLLISSNRFISEYKLVS